MSKFTAVDIDANAPATAEESYDLVKNAIKLSDLTQIKTSLSQWRSNTSIAGPTQEQIDSLIPQAAAGEGQPEILVHLLSLGGKFGTHSISLATSPEIFKVFLAHGWEVDDATLRSHVQHPELIALFLAHGANPNSSGPRGFSPLDIAALRGPLETVKLLLTHGAMIGSSSAALHAAAQGDTPDRIPSWLIFWRRVLTSMGLRRIILRRRRRYVRAGRFFTQNSVSPHTVYSCSPLLRYLKVRISLNRFAAGLQSSTLTMSGRTLAKSPRYSTRSTVTSKLTADEPSQISRKAMAKEEEKECSSSTHSHEDAPRKRPHLKRKRKNQSSITAVESESESESESPADSQLRQNQGSKKPMPAKAKGTGNASTATTTDEASTPPKKKRKSPESPVQVTKAEKRLRVFRKRAPQSYFDKLARATSQRMFVIDRTRGGTDEVPEETIDMAGSTGNIYRITICQEPRCTCPDNKKGHQCKHIVYVLHKVLKAPENLQYQLALLSSELREIFASAPTVSSQPSTDSASNRKEVTGDCPICFTEFEPDTEDIVWCKAACGNNIHKGCFEQWAKSQKGKEVRCVYCRTPWQGDPESLARIKTAGKVNDEGYVNVADQLGLSTERDYSTYHPFWVRRQLGGYY
ncbi:3'-5' exonuclease [Physcia stellaris]|nr:3'-5' exonuclease [Physcia stellaris]